MMSMIKVFNVFLTLARWHLLSVVSTMYIHITYSYMLDPGEKSPLCLTSSDPPNVLF